MKLLVLLLWFSLSALAVSAAGAAQAAAVSDPLVREALQRGLDRDSRWRALLLYVPRWGGRESSLIRAPGFFLAKNGNHDASGELAATIEAFLAPIGADPDTHAICRYPARFAFLRGVLNLQIPLPDCSNLQDWLADHHPQSAALVFSSYYLNNPASLFGHTFLLLHTVKEHAVAAPVVLDEAINFAATPTTMNALLYPYLGITGGFPGTFTLMPYYMKIQEYSNAERRDLWEYPLKLTPEEVHAMLLSLWEINTNPIPYYYLDENCSFVMLALLDAVRPSLHLTAQFRVFVTPADTIKAAWDQGLLGEPSFRPSSRTRYLARMLKLSAAERAQVAAVFSTTGPLPALSAPVLDAALDWTSYDEKLAGSKLSTVYKQRQAELLAQRAKQTDSGDETPPPPPVYQRPDRGPRSALVGIAVGSDAQSRPFSELTWRPTLHDLTAPSFGYSEALELELLRLTVRQTNDRLRLQTLRFFDALSTPSVEPMLLPAAWHLAIGVDREPFRGEGLRSSLEWGSGFAYSTEPTASGAPPIISLYAMPVIALGSSPSLHHSDFVAPGLLAGFGLEPPFALPLHLTGSLHLLKAYSYSDQPRLERRLRLTLAVAPSSSTELGCYIEHYDPVFSLRPEAAVTIGLYF